MTIAVRPDWNGNEPVHTFDDAQMALAYMRRHPCYEIVPDENIRLFGDIDFKVGDVTPEEFAELDRKIPEAIQSVMADEFRIALFSASSYTYRKISWRWTLPDGYVKSRDHAKLFAKYLYENLAGHLPEGATGDMSVYSKKRKMRTLWTSKPNENRPFRMVQGQDEDHIISYIPPHARFYDFPLEEKEVKPSTGEVAPKPVFTAPDESFLSMLCDCVSVEAWTGYKSCESLIFTLLSLGASGNLIHFYCSKAPNYSFDWVNGYIVRYNPAKNQHSIGTLKMFAKQGNPETYAMLCKDTRMAKQMVAEMTRLTTDSKTYHDWQDEKGFLKPLPVARTLAVQSQLGTGKTRRCIEACTPSPWNPQAQRILVISCRQSFTTHICAELPGFLDYRKTKAGSMLDQDRIVVQLQSLWRCGDMGPRDLILLDECESILASLLPNQTHKHYVKTYEAFEKLMRQAHRVIALDAFLTDRTMEVLRSLRGETSLCINPAQPYKKKADFVTESQLYDSIRKSLADDKRVIAIWGAVKPAVAFHSVVKCPSQVLYHRLSNPETKQTHLANVDKYWAEHQLVGYTSTITVGINYNGTPFDEMVLYATPWSCTSRDYIQALHRSRKVTDNHLTAYINSAPRPCAMEPGLDEQEKELNSGAERVQTFLKSLDLSVEEFRHIPDWLRRVHVWNLNEVVVNRKYFAECMKHYFRLCGIEYGEDAEAERPEKSEKGTVIQVVDVADIDYETAQAYARNRATLSDEQRYELEKYFMSQKVEHIDQFIWEAWLSDSRKIVRCYNLRMEDPRNLIHDKVIELVPRDVERLHIVQNLGWNWNSKWTLSPEEVPKVDLSLFGVRQRSEKDTPEQYCRDLCKALKQWCGIELTVERSRKRGASGQREYSYVLQFDPAGQVVEYIPQKVTAQEIFAEA